MHGHGQSELDWVSFKKEKKIKVAIVCVCGGGGVEDRVVVMVVCVGRSVSVLRFVWRSLGVGMGVLQWGGCVYYLRCEWVGGWVNFGQVA